MRPPSGKPKVDNINGALCAGRNPIFHGCAWRIPHHAAIGGVKQSLLPYEDLPALTVARSPS
ncbi:MAG: hypothetical protein V3T42_09140, partial [Nitrospirales bacterium]